jgi:transposase
MVLTAPPSAPFIVAGIDTHLDTHHVAVATLTGAILADAAFPATAAGHRALLDWVASHGVIDRIGVELTGSYGAGLTRHLLAEGVTVLEVNTADRATRARRGKDDRIDAIAAVGKVLAGSATAAPKDTTGPIEAIRLLLLAREGAVKARTQAINELKAVRTTAPAALRESLPAATGALVTATARLRPDPARLAEPEHAAKLAMRRLATRIRHLADEIDDAEADLAALVAATAPTLLTAFGVGPITAATLLVAVGQNIDRIPSEAALARLTGTAPIPVSSGKTSRHRLHRGGNRQANRAIHTIALTRLAHDPRTRAYRDRRLAEKRLSKRDIIRALKRAIVREIYRCLKTDLANPKT